MIWQDVDGEPFRDVRLHRGMNIVWSPCGDDPNAVASGHAAGKTMFCRFVRYCLGEDAFGDPNDTATIRQQFPAGAVAAEVRMHGETWVVRRRFAPLRDDRAARTDRIQDLQDSACRDSFAMFLDQVKSLFVRSEVGALLAGTKAAEDAWQYALAWLTRDQECRVDGLTHWRHPESSSHSPVRGSKAEERLRVLRVLLKLYTQDAREAERLLADAEAGLELATHAVRNSKARFSAICDEVATALGADREAIWPEAGFLQSEPQAREERRRALTDRADAQLRSARIATHADVRADLELERTSGELARVRQERENIEHEIEEAIGRQQLIDTKRAERWADVREAKHPTCPYDGALLDVPKAQFVCPLPRLPEPAEVEQLAREADAELRTVMATIAGMRQSLADRMAEEERCRERVEASRRRLRDRDREHAEATNASQAAWAAKGMVNRLFQQHEDVEEAQRVATSAEQVRDEKRERYGTALKASSASALKQWFNDLVRRIIAPEAQGRIDVGADDMRPEVEWRGRRRSVALNSLKIVLFDLAAMMCAVEGNSHAPAFLLHDSPREGDLDQWTYRRIFEAMLELGPDEEAAPFQYIVTTTTDPPAGPVRARVRLPLSTSEPSKRLLGVDL